MRDLPGAWSITGLHLPARCAMHLDSATDRPHCDPQAGQFTIFDFEVTEHQDFQRYESCISSMLLNMGMSKAKHGCDVLQAKLEDARRSVDHPCGKMLTIPQSTCIGATGVKRQELGHDLCG